MRWPTSRLLRTSMLLSGLIMGAFLLVIILAFWQSRIDETRAVDAIAILVSARNGDVLLDRGVDLYRRRYSRRMLIVTSDPATVQANLIAQGIPDTALIMIEANADNWRSVYRLAEIAHQQTVQSILIVDNPDELLLHLKVARDHGLSAYGSRTRTLGVRPGVLIQTSLFYWQYILIGPGT